MSEHTLKAKCSLFDSCDFWKVTILPLMCAHSCITWRINLIFTEKLVNQCRNNPAKLFCSKPYRFYAILNRGDLGFLLCLSWMNASVYVFFFKLTFQKYRLVNHNKISGGCQFCHVYQGGRGSHTVLTSATTLFGGRGPWIGHAGWSYLWKSNNRCNHSQNKNTANLDTVVFACLWIIRSRSVKREVIRVYDISF